MELYKIRYIDKGTAQHFITGSINPFAITSIYNTEKGYYIFYADSKLNNTEMISAIISNNIIISDKYFQTN